MTQLNYMQDTAPNSSFRPAELALFGTSDKRNPWREPLLEVLTPLVSSDMLVFNPVITGRSWNPDIDGPHEEYQKSNATNILFYLGNKGDGTISEYSAFELMQLLNTIKGSRSMAAILDPVGLETHPAKQLKSMRQTLEKYPETKVFETVGESLPWAIGRLGLESAFLKRAIAAAGVEIDAACASSSSNINMSAESISLVARTRVAELAVGPIDEIYSRIAGAPADNRYTFGPISKDWRCFNEVSVTTQEIKQVDQFVKKHFQSLGYTVYVDEERGSLVIVNSDRERKVTKSFSGSQFGQPSQRGFCSRLSRWFLG